METKTETSPAKDLRREGARERGRGRRRGPAALQGGACEGPGLAGEGGDGNGEGEQGKIGEEEGTGAPGEQGFGQKRALTGVHFVYFFIYVLYSGRSGRSVVCTLKAAPKHECTRTHSRSRARALSLSLSLFLFLFLSLSLSPSIPHAPGHSHTHRTHAERGGREEWGGGGGRECVCMCVREADIEREIHTLRMCGAGSADALKVDVSSLRSSPDSVSLSLCLPRAHALSFLVSVSLYLFLPHTPILAIVVCMLTPSHSHVPCFTHSAPPAISSSSHLSPTQFLPLPLSLSLPLAGVGDRGVCGRKEHRFISNSGRALRLQQNCLYAFPG